MGVSVGIDLAVIEKYDVKHHAIIWERSDNDNSTQEIEYTIRVKAH